MAVSNDAVDRDTASQRDTVLSYRDTISHMDSGGPRDAQVRARHSTQKGDGPRGFEKENFETSQENLSCLGKLFKGLAKRSPFLQRNMGHFLQKFDTFLNRSFYKLGHCIALHTGYFIIIPIFITIICATGFQQIQYEDDPEYLFAPTNGAARHERAVVESYFPTNYTWDYSPSRATRNGRFSRFIMAAKDNGSLLREEVWRDIMTVDEMIHNLTVNYNGREFKYSELCSIWDGECHENNILDIGELLPQVNNGTFNLTFPFMLNPNTFESYVFPFNFGGITTNNRSTIESVLSISLMYFIRAQNAQEDKLGFLWEEQIQRTFKGIEMENLVVTFFTSRTLETELEENTNSVVPYFGLTVGIMLVFCLISVTMGDCVRSKTLLGLAGILCAGLSCIAAFGLLIYIGVPFIGINMAAPFLMLGIGIDDTFVMLAAWRRSRMQDTVPERLAHTFAEAAVSITITSITDMISFYIGAITPFPSVQIFCIYTGTAVLLTYLWHITLFGGCLAISGYAEAGQKHAITCMTVKPVSESKDDSCCYRSCCSGGISEDDPWNPEDNTRHTIMVFFRDYVAYYLNKPVIKAVVVVVFLGYLSVAIWGCTMVNEGLERRKLSRYDSYSVKYYDLEDQYFRDFPYRIQIIITGDYNYSDPQTRDSVIGFLEKVEGHKNIGDPLYTEAWIRSWKEFMERNGPYLGLNDTDEKTMIANLKEYYLGGSGNNYALDLIFNEDETRIVATRFIVQAYKVMGAEEDRLLMQDMRRFAEESPLNVTVFHPFFIFFDQFTLVRGISIQAITLAAGVMMIVSLIFIPNPLCSLWVAFSIVSIEIGVVGYMTLWDVNLDSISMIQLIMCIGFSVDFSAHISYAYLAAKVDTPDERVRECLYALGLPIVQGGLSTILGIMALTLAPSYIFITFFKTVFLVIFFGAIHGIFLLPVLLSLLGPGSCSSTNKKTIDDNSHPPMYLENGDPRLRNDTSLALNAKMNHPAHSSNTQMIKDKHMQIPRPKSLGYGPNQRVITIAPTSSKVNGFNIPPGVGGFGREDSGSIERDLGIGTSGEESSESSLKQGVSRKDTPPSGDNYKRRDPAQDMYTNNGYISDDLEAEERRARERRGEYFGEWDNLESERSSRWQSARYTPTDTRGHRNYRSHQHQQKRSSTDQNKPRGSRH